MLPTWTKKYIRDTVSIKARDMADLVPACSWKRSFLVAQVNRYTSLQGLARLSQEKSQAHIHRQIGRCLLKREDRTPRPIRASAVRENLHKTFNLL